MKSIIIFTISYMVIYITGLGIDLIPEGLAGMLAIMPFLIFLIGYVVLRMTSVPERDFEESFLKHRADKN